MKKGVDAWTSCSINLALGTGDRIKTLAGEDVQISFSKDANFVKINENSDVVLLINQDGGSIDLLNGEALALINKLPQGSTFEMKTPSGVSGARGTGWGAKTDGLRSTFNSFERSIYVKGIDKAGNVMKDELVVREGLRTMVDKFERPERLEKLSSRDMERWSGWKDSLKEQPNRQREGGSKAQTSQAKEVVAKDKTDKETLPEKTDRDNARDKFEKVETSRDRVMDRRESQKQDMVQNRDAQRMERRMERKEPRREPEPPNGDRYKTSEGPK